MSPSAPLPGSPSGSLPSAEPLRALAVFCGSALGTDPAFLAASRQVGRALAAAGDTVVYGGGMAGLMGAVATSSLEAGGRVHGVIPRAFLKRTPPASAFTPATPEEAGPEARYLQTPVDSMHERKKLMAEMSRGFLALPGGYGTLEEVAEMTTWTQLGIHKKPVVLLNVLGFFSPLRTFVESSINAGFIAPQNRAFLVFVDAPADAVAFDWGTAALEAVRVWESKVLGGGVPLSLEWGETKGADLR